MAFAFLAPGLVIAAMLGWRAAARFADPLHPAAAPAPGSRAEIEHHVLSETVALTVMALALWPPLACLLTEDGPGTNIPSAAREVLRLIEARRARAAE